MREWNEAEQIRREVERQQGEAGGGRLRYKPALRRRAVAYLGRCEGDGETAWTVSSKLGLPWQTLRRWQQAGEGKAEPRVAFRRVAVERDERRDTRGAGLAVEGPLGLRIEGLTISELAELWRSLGA
jgi:hypothetical protein